MSQYELADKVGVGHMVIWHYEQGNRNPTREMVERMAIALECPELHEHFLTRDDVRDIRKEPILIAAIKRMMKKMGFGE